MGSLLQEFGIEPKIIEYGVCGSNSKYREVEDENNKKEWDE